MLFALALTGATLGYGPAEKSQKELIAGYGAMRPGEEASLTYLFQRPYSAEFYSGGDAVLLKDLQDVENLLNNRTHDCLAVRAEDLERLPESFKGRMTNLGPVHRYYLLLESAPPQAPEQRLLSNARPL
jgi:hypothetical protein